MKGLIAAISGFCVIFSPAEAAQCAAHDVVAQNLATQFGEVRRSIGLAQDNTVMETYASAETGTWTMTLTLPNGQTCLVAAGDHFETTAATLPAEGDPA